MSARPERLRQWSAEKYREALLARMMSLIPNGYL
jgi:hypothetical protein